MKSFNKIENLDSHELKQKRGKSVLWQTIGISMQLGYIITLPLIVLVIAGRILDKQYSSSPFFLLVGMFLALMVSSIAVFIKIRKIIKKIN